MEHEPKTCARGKDRRTGDADERPWLVIEPMMERAIMTALIRRYGGTLTMKVSELEATLGVNWGLEGFRSPEDPGNVHLRLRRLD